MGNCLDKQQFFYNYPGTCTWVIVEELIIKSDNNNNNNIYIYMK